MDQIVPIEFIKRFENLDKNNIFLAGSGDMFEYNNGEIVNNVIDYYILK